MTKLINTSLFGLLLWSSFFLTNALHAADKDTFSIDEESTTNYKTKQMIGMSEPVSIYPGNIVLTARIDTGANTTSLGAEDLQVVNEDGVRWAHYSVNGQSLKHKIIKFVWIKQHNAASQRRPVIKLIVTLADVTQTVDVTLTDRSNFEYKMLIGVNFLYDHFIVDVSQKNITTPSKAAVK